jgi:hypothetical protein
MITTFSLQGCLFSGLWLSAINTTHVPPVFENFKPRSSCAFIPFRVLAFCPSQTFTTCCQSAGDLKGGGCAYACTSNSVESPPLLCWRRDTWVDSSLPAGFFLLNFPCPERKTICTQFTRPPRVLSWELIFSDRRSRGNTGRSFHPSFLGLACPGQFPTAKSPDVRTVFGPNRSQ